MADQTAYIQWMRKYKGKIDSILNAFLHTYSYYIYEKSLTSATLETLFLSFWSTVLALWTHCYKNIKTVIDSPQLDMLRNTLALEIRFVLHMFFFRMHSFIALRSSPLYSGWHIISSWTYLWKSVSILCRWHAVFFRIAWLTKSDPLSSTLINICSFGFFSNSFPFKVDLHNFTLVFQTNRMSNKF